MGQTGGPHLNEGFGLFWLHRAPLLGLKLSEEPIKELTSASRLLQSADAETREGTHDFVGKSCTILSVANASISGCRKNVQDMGSSQLRITCSEIVSRQLSDFALDWLPQMGYRHWSS